MRFPFFALHAARKNAKTVLQEIDLILAYSNDLMLPVARQSLEEQAKILRSCTRPWYARLLNACRNLVLRRSSAPMSTEQIQNAAQIGRTALDAVLPDLPPRPNSFLFEIVETLVVAFGVAFAFRAYFFQPFKIPTGSMQPTLYGVHSQAFSGTPTFFDTHEPFATLQWLVNGRRYLDVVAPNNGSLAVHTDAQRAPGFAFLSVAGKSYKIPTDVLERGEIDLQQLLANHMADNPNAAVNTRRSVGEVRKGQRLWAGYVYAGDQVFVNRFLWNLRPPRRDEITVFATSSVSMNLGTAPANAGFVQKIPFYGIPLYLAAKPIQGLPPSQHYIKRLVGLPNETISIRPPFLCVNGKPVEGFPGIDRLTQLQPSETGPSYRGYCNTGDPGLPKGQNGQPFGILCTAEDAIRTADSYLPMGDNTRNSFDGRYWGPVPRLQMLGPAACVYWPISVRWGSIW